MSTSSTRRAALPRLLLGCLLTLATIFGVTVTLQHSAQLSPLDELVYIDYLDKLPNQGYIHMNEIIGPEALERSACDGTLSRGKPYAHLCGSDYRKTAGQFLFAGVQSADIYTPIYFWTVAGISPIFRLFGADELTSWRLVGTVYLVLSLWLMWLALRRWRVPALACFGTGLVMLASPATWWSFTFVSTDMTGFFAGALLLFLATLLLQYRRSGWWLAVAIPMVLLLKITNIMVVIVVASMCAAAWLRKGLLAPRGQRLAKLRDHRSWLLSPLIGGVLGIVSQIAWLVFRNRHAVPGTPFDQGTPIPLNSFEIIRIATQALGSIPAVDIPAAAGSALPVVFFVFTPATWLWLAGILGPLFGSPKHPHWTLALSIFVGALVAAPVVGQIIVIGSGSYNPIGPRYHLSLLAPYALMIGLALRSRFAQWCVVLYGLMCWSYLLFATCRIPPVV